ncbi:MAG: ABC transporter substrate-binding protein [Gammaproteobacteria bacterium]
MRRFVSGLAFIIFLPLFACDNPLNNPYPMEQDSANVFYSYFLSSPKTLDPARSYSSDESLFTAQIYEPPLQYHYLKRPYTLTPLTAVDFPVVSYLDKDGQELPSDADDDIAISVYTITIAPETYYQPHPALAKDEQGQYVYFDIDEAMLATKGIRTLSDFKRTGTRELTADDYVYQIKRLAHPYVQSPIAGLMSGIFQGLKDFIEYLDKVYTDLPQVEQELAYLDLREHPLAGVEALDRYRYQIKIRGKNPQFVYWLAMPFFAPMPWEADRFYHQPGMAERNITLDWYPIGTGAFMLTENNPNQRMVLSRNPNFHGEYYPLSGEPEDIARGLLDDAGKPLPFIDAAIFTLEKESIPRWNKFLQGYYDTSSVSSDSFEQAIQISPLGQLQLSPELQARGVYLRTSTVLGIMFLGFNMLDPVIGGESERARKLRRVLSIAVNYDEYISIFLNGLGLAGQGVIPAGVFGYQTGRMGMNAYVYDWGDGRAVRKPLAEAKALLAEAGYPNGRDINTGEPLILHYDVPATGGPDDKARFDWYRKQFAQLGIQLDIRATQYNRFQDKVRTGNIQLFSWGWLADYPDPENFLFLLYGPNSQIKTGGQNYTNYVNEEYDALFEQMDNMVNNPERLMLIDEMQAILRRDAPMLWGYYPEALILSQPWVATGKPMAIGNNTLKYLRIDPIMRTELRRQWNQPVIWPLWLVLAILIAVLIPVAWRYWTKEHRSGKL